MVVSGILISCHTIMAHQDSYQISEVDPLLHPQESEDSKIMGLYDWWKSQKLQHDRLPNWSSVDVIELKPWMGWLIIYGLIDDGADALYRLVGSRFAEIAGVDLTVKCVSKGSYGLKPNIVLEYLRQVSLNGHACFQRNPVELISNISAKHTDRLWMPFSEDGKKVDRIMLYCAKIEIQKQTFRY